MLSRQLTLLLLWQRQWLLLLLWLKPLQRP
jgi:hypothetical protein